MSRESARFQARSAFFGVGFTTAEAESVVAHPVRRRIVGWLILLGNAGVISILGSLVITFGGERTTLGHIAVLLGGLVVLALLASSRPVDPVLTRVIRRVLTRFTDLAVRGRTRRPASAARRAPACAARARRRAPGPERGRG
jgi:hypothetical protein